MQLKCRSLIAEIAPDLSGADASGGQFADDETVSKAGIVVVDIDRVEQVRVIPVSRADTAPFFQRCNAWVVKPSTRQVTVTGYRRRRGQGPAGTSFQVDIDGSSDLLGAGVTDPVVSVIADRPQMPRSPPIRALGASPWRAPAITSRRTRQRALSA